MIPALAAVAQSRRAPLRLRNYQATGEVETSDYGGLLKPAELEMYSRLARTMGYDKLALLANAQSNYGTLYPPTGYGPWDGCAN